jgi:hypothetical protein
VVRRSREAKTSNAKSKIAGASSGKAGFSHLIKALHIKLIRLDFKL